MRFSAAALLVAVLSMGAAAAAHAQAPIARSEFLAEPEDDPTELLVDFGFVETSGNNDVTTLTLREAYAYDPAGPWAFGQKASWLYGKQDGESNANTITFNLRADRDLGPRLAAYATAGYYRAPFGGVSRRFDEGVGLAWKTVRTPRDTLDLEAGVSLVQELSTTHVSDDYAAARVAGAYKRMLTGRAYAGATASLLSDFSDFSDFLLDSEAFLAAPLGTWLALRVSYQFRFDNSPPDGFETTDTVFTTGLQLQL